MRTTQLIILTLLLVINQIQGQEVAIDTSFGTNGFFLYDAVTSNSRVMSIASLPDQSLILGIHANTSRDPFCLKLTRDGDLDTAFADSGTLTLPTIGATNLLAGVQKNGKIIVALSTFYILSITRWFPDGTPDPSFGSNGRVVIIPPNCRATLASMVIDSQDRIILGTHEEDGVNTRFGVTRITPEGVQDHTFGRNGQVSITNINYKLYCYAVDCNKQDQIFAAGYGITNLTDGYDIVVAKLLESGEQDFNFGNQGFATYHEAYYTLSSSVKVQDDGKILAGGWIGSSMNGYFAVVRFHSDGRPDSSWGTRGYIITDFTGRADVMYNLVVQPDSRIIGVGYATVDVNNQELALARYYGNGSRDPIFGNDGKIITSVTTRNDMLQTVHLQSDWKIVAGGSYTMNSMFRPLVVRYKNQNPHLSITSFLPGEKIYAGSEKVIKWYHDSTVQFVKLEFSTNSGIAWSSIPGAEQLPASDTAFVWDVPNAQSGYCKVRISDVNAPQINAYTPLFTILPPVANIVIGTDPLWYDTDFDGRVTRTVSGASSSVPGDSIISYEWLVDGAAAATGAIAEFTLPTGSHTLALRITTQLGFQSTAEIQVHVQSAITVIGGSIQGAVSQAEDMFYVGSSDRSISRVDSTGKVIRKFTIPGKIFSALPISSLNKMYTGASDLKAYCFDLQLNTAWDSPLGGETFSTPAITADGNTIYVSMANGVIKAIDAYTGTTRWNYYTGRQITASPLLIQQLDGSYVIYIGTKGSSTIAPAFLALKDLGGDATLLWEKSYAADIISSAAILANEQNSMLYFTSVDGILHRIRWDGYSEDSWKVSLGINYGSCSPVIDENGIVYIGTSSGKLMAYIPDFITTTQVSKLFLTGSSIIGTPAIGKTGNLYFGARNGMFYALDITQDTFVQKWLYNAKVPFDAPTLVTESGVVVSGAMNGNLYVFTDPDFHTADNNGYNAMWPTFLGNNRRNRVVPLNVVSIEDSIAVPVTFSLHQNYPNPFNPGTTIRYALPAPTRVSLKVFDVLGKEVAVLVNQTQHAGIHTVAFDATPLPSGVYFYRIETDHNSSVKKMLLLK